VDVSNASKDADAKPPAYWPGEYTLTANGWRLTEHKQAFGGSAPSMTGVEH
jgi:hypothetical protein